MGRREELMPPMTAMARDPFPADLCNAEKVDEILSFLRPGQHEVVRKLEERLEGVTKELQQVHLRHSRLDHVSAEVQQLKAMVATLVQLQTKSLKNMPHGVLAACNFQHNSSHPPDIMYRAIAVAASCLLLCFCAALLPPVCGCCSGFC